MHSSLVRLALMAAVVALPFSAVAQTQNQPSDNRYGTWSPPGEKTAANKNLQGLLKSLNKLIANAEKAGAADPAFLRDLKKLAARYKGSWSKPVVSDNFSDGDYDNKPRWSVTSGEYWVEKGYGLRARVTAPASSGTTAKSLSKEDLAISILGAVLNGTNKNATNKSSTGVKSKPSAIETRADVSNSFSATLKMSSWKSAGTFSIGVNQGLGQAGYRVVYAAGNSPALSLVKVSARAHSVLGTQNITMLEDNNPHAIAWTRTANGSMTVKLDGKVVLSARDTSFRDRFDSLQFTSQGSDVIVKSVVLKGSK